MNRDQRAKIAVLTRCRIPSGLWDARFLRALEYQRRTAPDTVLTPRQRYQLDALVWRYRRQLVGLPGALGFDLPTAAPEPAAYQRRSHPPVQGSLL